MKLDAALANGAWLAASVPAWQRFRRGLAAPEESQLAILRRLLTDNAASAYGQAHDFAGIRSYEDFHNTVPVVTYAELEPWIARIMRGESGVLTREPVTRLLPTSGTTAGCKLIPFTASLQREFNRAIGPWMVDLSRDYPQMSLGSSYWSISPAMPVPAQESAVPIGFDDDSAYLGGIRQRLVEMTFAAASALRMVAEIEQFRYLTLLSLLRQPELSFASVWHPSFLALLFDALPGWWDELLDDIAKGGCRRASTERPEIRRVMSASPQRNRALNLTRTWPEDPQSIWPRLRLVSCWSHGQAALACADLQRRLPEVIIQPKGLLATEAFVSIPFRDLHPLAIGSHFFEFVEDGGENIVPGHALLLGRSYRVIVTTGGGLWRYQLGDLVEVDGFVGKTPSLRFIGRGSAVSDLCGEKLAEPFVTRAVRTACERSGFKTPFAMLAPEITEGERPRYLLFIEGSPSDGLADFLEEALRENPHYALCRDLGQLRPCACFPIPRDAYRIFSRTQVLEGRRLGEIKPSSLSSRTDWKQHFTLAANGKF